MGHFGCSRGMPYASFGACGSQLPTIVWSFNGFSPIDPLLGGSGGGFRVNRLSGPTSWGWANGTKSLNRYRTCWSGRYPATLRFCTGDGSDISLKLIVVMPRQSNIERLPMKLLWKSQEYGYGDTR